MIVSGISKVFVVGLCVRTVGWKVLRLSLTNYVHTVVYITTYITSCVLLHKRAEAGEISKLRHIPAVAPDVLSSVPMGILLSFMCRYLSFPLIDDRFRWGSASPWSVRR
jgi:hypothetical protein